MGFASGNTPCTRFPPLCYTKGMSASRSRPAVRHCPPLFLMLAVLLLSCETVSHSGRKEQGGTASRPPRTTETSGSESTAGKDWPAAASLDELEGIWESPGGALYEYPFRADGRKYLRLAWKETDDTELWKDWAARNNMDMETLWKIRFAYLSEIYGVTLPDSDAGGNQYGIKLSRRDGRIYSRMEMLVTERLIPANLGFFRMSPDKDSFTEKGYLRLASDKFNDLGKGGSIYNRRKEGGE